jgi:hypothetical protein
MSRVSTGEDFSKLLLQLVILGAACEIAVALLTLMR